MGYWLRVQRPAPSVDGEPPELHAVYHLGDEYDVDAWVPLMDRVRAREDMPDEVPMVEGWDWAIISASAVEESGGDPRRAPWFDPNHVPQFEVHGPGWADEPDPAPGGGA